MFNTNRFRKFDAFRGRESFSFYFIFCCVFILFADLVSLMDSSSEIYAHNTSPRCVLVTSGRSSIEAECDLWKVNCTTAQAPSRIFGSPGTDPRDQSLGKWHNWTPSGN